MHLLYYFIFIWQLNTAQGREKDTAQIRVTRKKGSTSDYIRKLYTIAGSYANKKSAVTSSHVRFGVALPLPELTKE